MGVAGDAYEDGLACASLVADVAAVAREVGRVDWEFGVGDLFARLEIAGQLTVLRSAQILAAGVRVKSLGTMLELGAVRPSSEHQRLAATERLACSPCPARSYLA